MRNICLLSTFALLITGCSTLNESIQLGGTIGSFAGAGATYLGHRGAGHSPSFGDVALGAGIGMAVGTLASYFIHGKVAENRETCEIDRIELHFGDLPPSPFVVPARKGGKR
jgi:hypothetical protein